MGTAIESYTDLPGEEVGLGKERKEPRFRLTSHDMDYFIISHITDFQNGNVIPVKSASPPSAVLTTLLQMAPRFVSLQLHDQLRRTHTGLGPLQRIVDML